MDDLEKEILRHRPLEVEDERDDEGDENEDERLEGLVGEKRSSESSLYSSNARTAPSSLVSSSSSISSSASSVIETSTRVDSLRMDECALRGPRSRKWDFRVRFRGGEPGPPPGSLTGVGGGIGCLGGAEGELAVRRRACAW